MTASIRTIRKRLLECLDRSTLADLSPLEDAAKRGRDRMIVSILDNWSEDADRIIQAVVDQSKLNPPKKGNYYERTTFQSGSR